MRDEQLEKLLRSALFPVGDTAPARDLWPELLARMAPPRRRFAWWDLAAAAAAGLWLVLFPDALPAILHHL